MFDSIEKEERVQCMLDIVSSQMHQNILPIYELLYDSENFYIMAAKIKGGTLQQLIEARKMAYFSEKQVKFVAFQLISALNHLI